MQNLRLTPGIFATACVLLGLSADARAQEAPDTDTVLIGSEASTGPFKRVLCPEREFMVGIEGKMAYRLNSVRPICVYIGNDTGQWTGQPHSVADSIGGRDGTDYRSICPVDTVVSGFDGQENTLVDGISLICRRKDGGVDSQHHDTYDLMRAAPEWVGGEYRDFTGGDRCRTYGTAANGVIGESGGTWVHSFGLRCGGGYPTTIPAEVAQPRWPRVTEVPPGGVILNPAITESFDELLAPRLYGITPAGTLTWSRYDGYKDGAAAWTHGEHPIGEDWLSFRHTFSGGNGMIFSVTHAGELLASKFTGGTFGENTWQYTKQLIGTGFDYERVLAAGGGVILAITTGGDMLAWKYQGLEDGANPSAAEPVRIGTGWNIYRKLFSDGEGVLYGIDEAGGLYVYRLANLEDPSAGFRYQNLRIGTGWTFADVTSAGDGRIFAITNEGDVLYYKYDGKDDGAERWSISASLVKSAWTVHSKLFGDIW
jgi:hypothetical protein